MLDKLLGNIAGVLGKRKIPYMVIGGQAVLIYGEPRLTKDIDITLGVGIERLDDIIKCAGDLKLKILVDNPDRFVRKNMVIPLSDNRSGFRVDFIFSFTDYERNAINRAKGKFIGKKKVYFASVEDIIIHKVFAGRPRDIEDVKNILQKNREIDRKYITKWLRVFDESEKLLKKFKNLLLEII